MFIEVPPFSPESDQLTVFAGLLVPVTYAVNCFVEPRLTVTAEALRTTFAMVGVGAGFAGVGVGFAGVDAGFEGVGVGFAGVGAVTFITVVPLLDESAVDVALTVMVPGA